MTRTPAAGLSSKIPVKRRLPKITTRRLMILIVLLACLCWLGRRAIFWSLAPVHFGDRKIFIPLQVTIVDNATGQPVAGAMVGLQHFSRVKRLPSGAASERAETEIKEPAVR